MYKPEGTVKDALSHIEKGDYVLPAIQREFVWEPDQICKFYDSLMRGYPFGTFLFWRIDQANSANYKFYGFVRDYHERDRPHCPEMGLIRNRQLTAVLDGQQRLTALNIGLRGSMAQKEPYKRKNSLNAYPEKFLYINLLRKTANDEQGNAYEFQFIEPARADSDILALWFKVSDILAMDAGPSLLEWLTSKKQLEKKSALNNAFKILNTLHQCVHTSPSINCFEETSQDVERVLNIFIRTNSGGTVLSYSDLLLSIAVAQWSKLDARKEIHRLVDELNAVRNGFGISKDFVLKAGLMLTDIASVGFKVENFTHENMEKLENAWSEIRRALSQTIQLVASFGMDGYSLRAVSALLPIAYYLYRKSPPDNYLSHSTFDRDRQLIRKWLVRSVLKPSGIWGSGLDTLLTAIRATIQQQGTNEFPSDALKDTMARRGKSLSFEPEEVDELADLRYGDRRTFVLLSLLYPFVDLKNQFHVDHVFPSSRFTSMRLRKENVPEGKISQIMDYAERLGNLQLLEGTVNNEKRVKLPGAWLKEQFETEDGLTNYCRLHDLQGIPDEIASFEQFYIARRESLKKKIAAVVNAA